jgi:hypothetical protein
MVNRMNTETGEFYCIRYVYSNGCPPVYQTIDRDTYTLYGVSPSPMYWLVMRFKTKEAAEKVIQDCSEAYHKADNGKMLMKVVKINWTANITET